MEEEWHLQGEEGAESALVVLVVDLPHSLSYRYNSKRLLNRYGVEYCRAVEREGGREKDRETYHLIIVSTVLLTLYVRVTVASV